MSVQDEDLSDVTLADMLAEVKRELAMRQNAYPAFVQRGRLKPEAADRQTRRLRAVLKVLLLMEADTAIASSFLARLV
jgi:hypothetical protein